MSSNHLNTQEFLDRVTQQAELTGDIQRLKTTFSTPEETVATFLGNSLLKKELAIFAQGFFNSGRFLKSREISEKYRNEGNSVFCGPSPKLALKYFTLALKHAPNSSKEVRLAFGNRSAVLFLMEEYEKSLKDMEYALEGEPNFERRVKLLVRKAKCFSHLRRYKEASDVYHTVKDMLQNVKPKDLTQKLQNLSKEADHGLQKVISMEDSGSTSYMETDESLKSDELPEPIYGHNPNFPYASDALILREDPEKGRHVVTKQPIHMGDVLFVEKPFAFVVLPVCSTTHCHNCCVSVLNPLPCEGCTEASFCSKGCRREAWESYHRWECGPGLDLCYSLGIAHLGLRLAIVGHTVGGPKYPLVTTLVSHLEHLNAPDLFQFTMTATLLGTYLESCTDFFQTNKDCSFTNFSGILLLHIAQLICNGHAITGLTEGMDEGKDVYSEEQIRIATAIFPSASMMNHSCDSNIMNSFSGQYLIVKASREIPAGGEVFNCYGPHYRRMNWADRQKCLMEQYKFTCRCTPCTNPAQKEFQQRFCGYLCNGCSGPVLLTDPAIEKYTCSDCFKSQCVAHIEKILIKADSFCALGDQAMDEHDIQKALKKYLKALDLKEGLLYKHHLGIRECKDKIAKCYAILGQYEQSYRYVEDSLFGDEEQFGLCSSEFAYEVLKLSDICFKICETLPLSVETRQVVEKTISYMDRAKIVVDVLFGKWHTNYKELISREQHFKELLCKRELSN